MKSAKDYIAILDIGSNAVRLVVYDGLNRAPVKIHNERNVCSLGRTLGTTGRLDPEGVERALDSIARFSGLLKAMKIRHVTAVATAALRDAADGRDFIARVKKDFGLAIRVIDGEEEARLSALGVMMNGLGDGGVIGDFGGGSLELIVVDRGRVAQKASLPIGSHRMLALPDRAAQAAAVDAALARVDFLKACGGRDFYAIGGAWRSMARAHLRMTGHPLRVLDHYSIDGAAAREYAALIARQSLASLEKTEGLSPKRVKDMGAAALVMERLFAKIAPSRLVFSATSLREGLIYDQLPPAIQRQDALIAFCRKAALKISRFDDLKSFNTLLLWMSPLFAGEDPLFFRLLEAAALLSDTSWFEHEDYQAVHAFERMLVLPYYGIDHAGRGFLAVAQYVRYAGGVPEGIEPDPRAVVAGLAMRAAYLMTAGALDLLKDSALEVSPDKITLRFRARGARMNAEVVAEAINALAAATGRAGGVAF